VSNNGSHDQGDIVRKGKQGHRRRIVTRSGPFQRGKEGGVLSIQQSADAPSRGRGNKIVDVGRGAATTWVGWRRSLSGIQALKVCYSFPFLASFLFLLSFSTHLSYGELIVLADHWMSTGSTASELQAQAQATRDAVERRGSLR
jgi:hypothetical protein